MNENVKYSEKKEKREAEILEAALDAFAELGFRKASVEDIAGRLGVAAGTLYLYARDKRDLYKKAVARAFGFWQDEVKRSMAAVDDPIDRFRVACRTAFRYLADEPRLRRILARDPELFPVVSGDDPFSDINRVSAELLASLIREGQAAGAFAPGDATAAARIFFSLYVLFVQKAYVAGEAGEEALFERCLDLVLDGLRARE